MPTGSLLSLEKSGKTQNLEDQTSQEAGRKPRLKQQKPGWIADKKLIRTLCLLSSMQIINGRIILWKKIEPNKILDSQSLRGSALGPLHIRYGCIAWYSFGTPKSESLWLFLILGYCVQPWWCPFLSKLVRSSLVDVPGRPALFWREMEAWIWG